MAGGLRSWSHVDSHMRGSAEEGTEPLVGASVVRPAGPQRSLPASPGLAAHRVLGLPTPSPSGQDRPQFLVRFGQRAVHSCSCKISLQVDTFPHRPPPSLK